MRECGAKWKLNVRKPRLVWFDRGVVDNRGRAMTLNGISPVRNQLLIPCGFSRNP